MKYFCQFFFIFVIYDDYLWFCVGGHKILFILVFGKNYQKIISLIYLFEEICSKYKQIYIVLHF